MKQISINLNKFLIAGMMIIVLMFTASCTPSPAESEPVPEGELTLDAADDPSVPEEPELNARFTMQAEPDLQDALSALYGALFDGEQAVFVESGADIAVVNLEALPEGEAAPMVFIPGAALVAEEDSADIRAFIDFSISPDGQMALIEAGLLPESVVVVDQAGLEVEVQMPVYRVISSNGPNTFMFYAVGAGDRLVGASYLGARDPKGAAAMERIDPNSVALAADEFFSQSEFNIEEAVTLDPQLVAATARTDWIGTVEEIGVPVVRYDGETPERLKEAMLITGELMGPYGAARAEAWVEYYDRVVDSILSGTSTLADEDRTRVLFTGTNPLRVASGEMYQSEMIRVAGGVSVTGELIGYWNDVNIEQILLWDPDVILVPPYGGASVEAILESPEWQILDAVVEGRVYRMPKLVAPWDVPTPDSVLGVIWMTQLLYPDLVPLDCAVETGYYYNTFYDYAISDEEVQDLCAID